jgi:hypothetical protein
LAVFIGSEPEPIFKYLGRYIQHDLKQNDIERRVQVTIKSALEKIHQLPLTGPMKAWIVNHVLCAKVSWSLMIHEFSDSKALEWDMMIRGYYRKWLGLASMAEPGVLYRSEEHFGLNLKSLKDVQGQLQVVKWHIMKTSQDEKSRELYNRRLGLDRKGHIGRGRKTSPCLIVEEVESAVRFDEKFSRGAQTTQHGLGFVSHKSFPKLTVREQLMQRMKKEAEEKRVLLAYDYQMQTNWVEYGIALGKLERKDMTWRKLFEYTPNLVKFCLNAQSNTLPTPDNLRRWNQTRDLCCGLCASPGATLSHILCGCPWVHAYEMKLPRESRFKWRHDCVLNVLLDAIRAKTTRVNALPRCASKDRRIEFVRAGEAKKRGGVGVKNSSQTSHPPHLGLLSQARDWKVVGDLSLDKRSQNAYTFPAVVAATSLRPDIVVFSETARFCIVGPELTAPMEENIGKWRRAKFDKYNAELMPNLEPGWRIHVCTAEVGARGWIPPHFTNDLRRVFGFSRRELSQIADNCALVARKCSYVIWLNRFNKHFEPIPILAKVQLDGEDSSLPHLAAEKPPFANCVAIHSARKNPTSMKPPVVVKPDSLGHGDESERVSHVSHLAGSAVEYEIADEISLHDDFDLEQELQIEQSMMMEEWYSAADVSHHPGPALPLLPLSDGIVLEQELRFEEMLMKVDLCGQ